MRPKQRTTIHRTTGADDLRVIDTYFMSLSKQEIIRSQRAIIIGLEKLLDKLEKRIAELENGSGE